MNNNILVTGGSGFIGSHVCERLINENHKVICIDNFDPYYDRKIKESNLINIIKNKNFTLLEGDIRDQEFLYRVFRTNKFSEVIHLAAQAGVRQSVINPEKYYDVNLKGTLNLLERVKEEGVSKFIYASSSSVYGLNKNIPFSEEDTVQLPASPYAASKIAGEVLCHTYSHIYSIPIICLRFFTVYGPRQRPDMAIFKFIHNAFESGIIEIYGNGSSKRDYTYIDDIIDGVMASLDLPCKYEIFNLGNSKTLELEMLIDIIRRSLKKEIKIQRVNSQPGDVPFTQANISKATKYLAFNPKTDVEEGIIKYINWYQTIYSKK